MSNYTFAYHTRSALTRRIKCIVFQDLLMEPQIYQYLCAIAFFLKLIFLLVITILTNEEASFQNAVSTFFS